MLDSLRDAHQQLEGLRLQRCERNPELYRDLALYLQVLRDGLLNTVQQACFHLAAEVHPDRYRAMESSQRRQLHRRLRALVRRACSLLTVEQLAQLAAQQARERLADQRSRQHQWLEGLGAELKPGPRLASDPPGSVSLKLHPPLDLLDPASPLLAGFAGAEAPAHPSRSRGELGAAPDDARLPPGLMEAFTAVVEHLDLDHEDDSGGTDSFGPPPPWDQGQLPREATALLVWLDGFEEALGRRLRNLSHAINVELLRLGLSRSLLPLSLLEAACRGQLEQRQAPPNLLRLPVPGLEALAVLLRANDLEQQLPALHSCRNRWRQHRQEVLRMAELSRRLRRRVQVLEAEQLWLQDIASTQSSTAGSPQT